MKFLAITGSVSTVYSIKTLILHSANLGFCRLLVCEGLFFRQILTKFCSTKFYTKSSFSKTILIIIINFQNPYKLSSSKFLSLGFLNSELSRSNILKSGLTRSRFLKSCILEINIF